MIRRGLAFARDLKERVTQLAGRYRPGVEPTQQDLDPYWDPKMAALLETWGEGNAWLEIQLLLTLGRGKVLDIACGTGRVMQILDRVPSIEVHGVDISDFLIGKAVARRVARERLTIGDATKMPYPDGSFVHAYSIGSLEHFTEDGLTKVIAENRRICTGASFHMLPVSRSGRDEGWLKRMQSYHNNSVGWWRDRFRASFARVDVLDSTWNDAISYGKWFVCS